MQTRASPLLRSPHSPRPLPALIGVIALSAALGRPGLPGGASEAPNSPEITVSELREHVRYLASPELAGRGSGTPGNDAAADFLAKEFRSAGLAPAGEEGSYFQRFPVFTGVEMGPDNRLTLRSAGKEHRPAAGQDFLPLGFSANGGAYAPVVFAGYGISQPDLKYDDYRGLDVRGKVVIVLRHTPDQNDDGPFAPYSQLTYKTMTAREKGAAAVLLVTGPLGDRPIFFGDAPAVPGAPPAPLRRLPLGSASADCGIPAAIVHPRLVESLLRPTGLTLRDLQIMIAHGKTQSRLLPGARVGIRIDVRRQTAQTRNVLARIEGSDPRMRDEFVVVGAHFDHLGMGGEGSLHPSSEPAVHHGADDNASGTAALLEVAEFLQSRRGSLARSVLFMGFTGEEMGLLGSAHWTRRPTVPLAQVAAMLNMDMVGRLSRDAVQVIGTGTSPAWPELLASLQKSSPLAMKASQSTLSGFGGSDQQSFYAKGIPVLFFFTGPHPDYHRPTDTWEKLNYEGLAEIGRLVANAAEQVSRMPRPGFTRAKEEPSTGGGGFRVFLGTIPDYSADVEGVALQGVREGSPAEKAGIRAGDILVEFGGKKIRNVQEYTVVLGGARPNQPVDLVVVREGRRLTLRATPAARR